MRDETASELYSSFVAEVEPRLRRALSAGFGPEVGREAAAEALIFGWEHWERVGEIENPAGYLYRVGRDKEPRVDVDLLAVQEFADGLGEGVRMLDVGERWEGEVTR